MILNKTAGILPSSAVCLVIIFSSPMNFVKLRLSENTEIKGFHKIDITNSQKQTFQNHTMRCRSIRVWLQTFPKLHKPVHWKRLWRACKQYCKDCT